MRHPALSMFAVAALLLASCSDGDSTGSTSSGEDATVQDDTGAIDTGSAADTALNTDTGTGDTASAGDSIGTDDVDNPDTTGTDSDSGDQDTQTDCPGASGCACTTNFDCDNSICLDTPEGKRCAVTCIDACDKGYSCQNIGAGDVVFVCVPDF